MKRVSVRVDILHLVGRWAGFRTFVKDAGS